MRTSFYSAMLLVAMVSLSEPCQGVSIAQEISEGDPSELVQTEAEAEFFSKAISSLGNGVKNFMKSGSSSQLEAGKHLKDNIEFMKKIYDLVKQGHLTMKDIKKAVDMVGHWKKKYMDEKLKVEKVKKQYMKRLLATKREITVLKGKISKERHMAKEKKHEKIKLQNQRIKQLDKEAQEKRKACEQQREVMKQQSLNQRVKGVQNFLADQMKGVQPMPLQCGAGMMETASLQGASLQGAGLGSMSSSTDLLGNQSAVSQALW